MAKLKKKIGIEGKKQILYGTVMHEGKLCAYCSWKWGRYQNELISIPYGEMYEGKFIANGYKLIHLVDGELVETTEFDNLLWSQVAGWLGADELAKKRKL